MGPSRRAACCEKWPPRDVSSTAEEYLRSAAPLVELVSVTKRMTLMSLHQGHSVGRYAFESCLTLASITFVMDHTNKPRALPEGAFCGAGIEQLCLPVHLFGWQHHHSLVPFRLEQFVASARFFPRVRMGQVSPAATTYEVEAVGEA